MKNLLIILFLLPLFSLAQSYRPNTVNNDFINYNRFNATKTKVGTQTLTQAKIITWDATAVEINDTVTLQSAISLLPFIISPKLTTTEINALTSITEGTFIYDSTLHVFKYWNGSEWKTITTN
jgi:hypothetical protein